MAEFSDLGKHCSDPTCRIQDFLPFTCSHCDHVFCLSHRQHHVCQLDLSVVNTLPQCVLCNQFVRVGADQSPDVVMEYHIMSGCKSWVLDTTNVGKMAAIRTCVFPRCKKHELVPIVCSLCHANFCIKHRDPIDHKCVAFENKISSTTAPVSKLIPAASVKPIASKASDIVRASQNRLPPHLRLMQMKARAIGQVDEIDRVCYEIEPAPALTSKKPQAINFSKKWTVGKCIDVACNLLGIPNGNNESQARV